VKRILFLGFGVICHALFFIVFAWMACFVGNFFVSQSIDAGVACEVAEAVVIDSILLLLFCVPHSVMARPAFKRWWTKLVPEPIERSVYVLVANAFMILLLLAWRPVDVVMWSVESGTGKAIMWGLFAAGWLLVPLASLMINHFDLFGTRQVWLYFRQRSYTSLPFRTPGLYRFVRHPLYVGWIVAFWATPVMTAGHLIFAAAMTTYMLVAIGFEERDLRKVYGSLYERYRQRVGGLIPRPAMSLRNDIEPESGGLDEPLKVN